MDLVRLDSNPNLKPDEEPNDLRRSEFGIEVIDQYNPESSLRMKFYHFGRGTERSSSFAVEVSWIDVKGFVREFIRMNHPEAAHLRRIIKLAEAIEQAGWSPNPAPPAEFWDFPIDAD